MRRTSKYCSIKQIAPHIIRMTPANVKPAKMARLGIIALTHGNEVLGAPIVNHLIELLLAGKLQPKFEIQFALGNVAAALADRRFIDGDLNRSFGLNSDENHETRRARELEAHFFDQCEHVLDLHQTIQPSRSPFFFFYYFSKKQLAFLDFVNPGLPVVVTLDDNMHGQKGKTTNQYLRDQKKICLTIELGQKGFFDDTFNLGVQVATNVLAAVSQPSETFESLNLKNLKSRFLKIEVGCRVQQAGSRLKPGWANLEEIKKGEVIGYSENGPITAPIDGYMLFPKYNSTVKVGQELFCICRDAQPEEYATT